MEGVSSVIFSPWWECLPLFVFFRTHISNMHVYCTPTVKRTVKSRKEERRDGMGWDGVWWVESCQCELTFPCRDSESSVSARDRGVNVSKHLNVKSCLVLHSCCFGIWFRVLRAKVLSFIHHLFMKRSVSNQNPEIEAVWCNRMELECKCNAFNSRPVAERSALYYIRPVFVSAAWRMNRC